jgi:hypothetical protein
MGIFSQHRKALNSRAFVSANSFVRLIVGISCAAAERRCPAVRRIWIIDAGTYKITTDPWTTI